MSVQVSTCRIIGVSVPVPYILTRTSVPDPYVLGLPDPLVRSTDPDPDPSIVKQK
jgi:hypothetical protein